MREMINFDPEIDPLFDEPIATSTTTTNPSTLPAVENHIEDYNSDIYSDTLSVYDDYPLDIVFANEIQIEFQPPSISIQFGLTKDPVIFENHKNYIDGCQ